MADIPIYQVDAFTDRLFTGNPAAVCPLERFPDDALLQAIALENNLSETAFLVPLNDGSADFHLRWFTPGVEVALCGHATLAAAHVVFQHLSSELSEIRFKTLSGPLVVTRVGDRLSMDFPAFKPKLYGAANAVGSAMGLDPTAILKSDQGDRDLLLVYQQQTDIESLAPDLAALRAFAPFGFIATAPGEGSVDFVSRCFFPNHGLGEDPVTGSAHSVSGPYWANILGKTELHARQISARSGDLWLNVSNDRIQIAGQAVEVMRGTLFLP